MNKKGIADVFTLLIILGFTVVVGDSMVRAGHWGKDGDMAVKNCVGTHVNDNCAHMKIKDL
jgi:hypothetical protein